ncbi:polycystin-2-like protein 1 [Onthophagus taurus]|uniref:polycystin-2-like protein 1 n=1 Tax=Onthophagus taurus TaxID=166361 RepID=UPI0039BDB9D1
MLDFQTKFLGVARLRQKKVVARKCPDEYLSAEVFKITKCIPPYAPRHEDKTSKQEVDSLWKYYSPNEAGLTAYFGRYSTYYGGGYITNAGRTLQNAYYNLNEIAEENWINRFTRVVFIEFWAYNANTNLFSIITICFEFHPTGCVAKSYMIYSLSLMFVDIHGQLIVISMFLLYCILVFFQFANIVSKIIYDGWEFWKRGINYLDMIILFGNFSVIGLHVHKQTVVNKILDDLSRNKNNVFTKYFLVEYYIEAITIFIAVLMCISVLGTWRFLRFGFMFKVFEKAIKTQTGPLISAFIYSFAMYVPYIIISRILFGSYTEMFKNIYSSIIVVSLLGVDQYPEYDFDEIQTILPMASMIFYASYRIWQQVVVNLYIAIITLHYEDSRDFVANQRKEFSILTYFIEELKYFCRFFNRKKKYLRGGTENVENIDKVINDTPKVTKIYDDEEQASGIHYQTSNKLQLIALVFFATLYNRELRQDETVFTESDYDLIFAIAWYYKHQHDGEKLTYYHMKPEHEKQHHFMSKEEVETMEMVTNQLFEPEPEITKPKIKGPKPISDRISLKRLNLFTRSLSSVDTVMNRINVVKKPRHK